jgi:ribosomal protein RSM22 (predicted rRNA methylase)
VSIALNSFLQKKYGLDLSNDSKKIADDILKLSDFYIKNPQSQTPWEERWAQIAYLVYFKTLNTARIAKVFSEIKRFGLDHKIENILDFGSGLGTLNWIWPEPKYQFVESSNIAQSLHKELGAKGEWLKNFDFKNDKLKNSLAFFSYSITELNSSHNLDWLKNFDYVLIVEPATHQDGRELMKARADFINQGWHVVAPCTHMKDCPLLTKSESDWCHDRVAFDRPDWFLKIENHLPMKNQTLALSYLLLSQQPYENTLKDKARVVGDLLYENGKARQLVCFDENRNFLSWMDRDWKKGKNYLFQELSRGDLIDTPTHYTQKSNELRLIRD